MVGQLWPQGAPSGGGSAGGPVLDIDFGQPGALAQLASAPTYPGSLEAAVLENGYLTADGSGTVELCAPDLSLYGTLSLLHVKFNDSGNPIARVGGRKRPTGDRNNWTAHEMNASGGTRSVRVIDDTATQIGASQASNSLHIGTDIWIVSAQIGPMAVGFILHDPPSVSSITSSSSNLTGQAVFTQIGHADLVGGTAGLPNIRVAGSQGAAEIYRWTVWSLD